MKKIILFFIYWNLSKIFTQPTLDQFNRKFFPVLEKKDQLPSLTPQQIKQQEKKSQELQAQQVSIMIKNIKKEFWANIKFQIAKFIKKNSKLITIFFVLFILITFITIGSWIFYYFQYIK